MELLAGFACALVLITLVGHGIWVLVAAMIRAASPPKAEESPARPRRVHRDQCPSCSTRLVPNDRDCPNCGLELDGREARRLERVRTAQNEITKLVENNALDHETADRVLSQLDRRARELYPPPSEPAPEPIPVARPVAAPARPVPVAVPVATEAELPVPPAEPPVPVETASRRGALAGFLEERNILWGELVGGLLIVGCSIALVLTLWRSLEALPYFPFLLSTAITAALFGAGQYTLHHWKLQATSRGLLVIAMLLTPLNLLLLAGPGAEVGSGWVDGTVKAVAVLVFVGIVRAAGRDLIGTELLPGPVDRRWLLAVAAVGAPLSQAVPTFGVVWLPTWLPAVFCTAACGAVLGGLTWYRGKDRSAAISRPQATAVLTFVGLSLFALFASWGLVLTRAADLTATFVGLALPLALVAVPLTEAGLLVHRRTVGHPVTRAAGTGATVTGAILFLTAVTLAWPNPGALALVATLVGLTFTYWAWRESVPWFQAGAVPALGLAVVLGVQGWLGGWAVPEGLTATRWVTTLLTTSTSGITLASFALLLAVVAEVIMRAGDRPQAVGSAIGAATAGVLGLFLVTLHGVEDPWPVVGVYAAGAVGLWAVNARWRLRVLAEAGAWLVLTGAMWVLWAVVPEDRSVWALTIALESLAFAGTARCLVGDGRVRGQFRGAVVDVAAAAGVLALILAASVPGFPEGGRLTAAVFAVAAAAFVLTPVTGHPGPMWAGSVLTLLGLIHLNVYTVELRPPALAVLLAVLGHGTLAVGAAFIGRRSSRLYGDPLRFSGLGSSALALPLVLFPVAGFVPEWAGATVWLAVLGFVFAWQLRSRTAFSAGQAAVAWATALGAFVWIERQEWWAPSELGFRDPRCIQAIAAGLAALALVWVAVRWAVGRSDGLLRLWLREPISLDRFVTGGAILVTLVHLIVAVVPGVQAEWTPLGDVLPIPPAELAHAFGPGAWVVLGLFAAALVAASRFSPPDEPNHDAPVLGLAVLGVCVPIALAGPFAPVVATASALRWGLAGVFLAGTTVLVFRETITRALQTVRFPLRLTDPARRVGAALVAGTAVVVVVLTIQIAVMGMTGQTPSGPLAESVFARMGWTTSALVPLGLLVIGLTGSGVRERSPGYTFAAGMVFTWSAAGGYALAVVMAGGTLGPAERVRLGVIAAGSAAAWSLVWQLALRRVPGGPLLIAQTAFGLVAVAVLAVIPLAELFLQPSLPLSDDLGELGRLGWIALILAGWAGFELTHGRRPAALEHIIGFVAVVAGLFAACSVRHWDEPGRSLSFHTMAVVWAVAGILLTVVSRSVWVVVLAAGVSAAAVRGPTPEIGRWAVPLVLASYALVATLASRVVRSRREWVLASFGIVGVTAVVLAVGVTLGSHELSERLAGPLAFALLAIGLGVLERRVWALATLSLGWVLAAWAVPDPDGPVLWLHRNAWAFVVVVVATTVGMELVPRVLRSAGWSAAARQVAGGLFPVAFAALLAVLIQQVPVFDPVTRRTPLPFPAVLAVLGGIAVLVGLAFRFAVRPDADPYRLSDTRRTGYVYLAELTLVLFFVHVRFNLPELFLGQAVRYWTFLVMLLAFVGVGLADLFERRGLRVLARPMRRTGLLLPLVPLVAFWTKPPDGVLEFADTHAPGVRPFLGYLEKLPQHLDSYAWLWFLAGALYGLLALTRRSFGWALLAALAANAGLWSLLAHGGVSAMVHPQVWVIPLALIVLVSEHVNRRELRADVSAGLRYLGIGMVYVSSAADLFIAGVGQTWWLPIVLALLCLGGMLAGIVLRVRAFLFLGVGFLTLDVFAMIWHAAVDRSQTWVWYASGIVLGAVILALFAVFEKRRNDVLAVVDRVRHWD